MGKPKVKRKSTLIDMTAMSDVTCSLDDEVATHILALVGGVHVTGDADEHLAFHRTVDIAVALDLGSADQNGNEVRQGHFDFRHGARGDNPSSACLVCP